MSELERRVVITALDNGCCHDPTKDTHIDMDFLRRLVELPPTEILEVLRGVKSLGFETDLQTNEDGAQMVHLAWHLRQTERGGNATNIAYEMIHVAQLGYCRAHGQEALDRLDFSQLSSSTAVDEGDSHDDDDDQGSE